MADPAILEGQKRLGPLIFLAIHVDAERIEAHTQHRLKISAPVLAVVHADAIQKIRPWQQAAHGKTRARLPRRIGRRQLQALRLGQRIDVAVDAKQCTLPLQKIKDGIQQRLVIRPMQMDLCFATRRA